MNQQPRIGNFTSSEIHRLVKEGRAKGSRSVEFDRYIAECNMERRLKRSVEQETTSHALQWGKLLENYAFDKLGASYKRTGVENAIAHPKYPYWVGSPDGIGFELDKADRVAEIKNPFTLLSFCKFANCTTIDEIREQHPDGEKYYWQANSGACILGLDKAELIIHCPYEDELPAIRELASISDDIATQKWLEYCRPDELPYLLREGGYKDCVRFTWDVTPEIKDFLTAAVVEAGAKLF